MADDVHTYVFISFVFCPVYFLVSLHLTLFLPNITLD